MIEKVKQDEQLVKYLKRIAQQNEVKFMIFRGCITGIFTALGTLIGLGIIVFIGVQLLPGLSVIPVVDEILRITKLDILIENQVNDLTGQNDTSEGDDTTGVATEPVKPTILTYQNDALGIEFKYPSTLTSVQVTASETDPESKLIELTGQGSLVSLQIYSNQTTTIVGNSIQRFVNRPNGNRVTMNVYEDGALVGGEQYSNVIYAASISGETSSFQFIGIADTELPKTAREVFVEILESVTFK